MSRHQSHETTALPVASCGLVIYDSKIASWDSTPRRVGGECANTQPALNIKAFEEPQ